MSKSVLLLLIFYGGLVMFGVAGLSYALLLYRRGRCAERVTAADVDAANARAEMTTARFPVAREAWYDDESGRVVVGLGAGMQFSFPAKGIPGLEGASPEDLREIAVSASGVGLHFPRIDADVYLPAVYSGERRPAARSGVN